MCRSLLALLILMVVGPAVYAAEFKIPALSGPVVDQAGMFRESTRQKLADFLFQIRQRGGAQLQVATIQDLSGLSIEEASIKITDSWKLGNKKEDRGVLLLFAPTERKVRIEVGRGLEGDLPDVTTNRIIREVIVPRMHDGTADRAVIDGVMAILHYTDPNLLDSEEVVPHGEKRRSGGLLVWLFWLFFLFFFILPIFSRRWRNTLGDSGLGGFLLGVGLGSLGGGGGGGGSWGSGGGGGGGWSGGGGGFGGGGSSGSW